MNILLLLKQFLMCLYLYRTSINYLDLHQYHYLLSLFLSLSLSVGIGSPLGSIPLAATLSWIIKDGLGQLGRR